MKGRDKLKNKKRNLILTLMALVVVAVGGTYAWWTATVAANQKITMGKLTLTADFPELQDEIDFEPGLSSEITGTITNTGSLEAIARVENSSQIKYAYSDDNFTPVTELAFVKDTENAIALSFGPGNDSEVYWFKDVAGNAYVLFEVGGKIDTTFVADFSGEVMGNKYQEAEIKIGAKLKATQVLDEAMTAEFGITMNDLVDYSRSTSRQARSATTNNLGNPTKGEQRLQELIARNK